MNGVQLIEAARKDPPWGDPNLDPTLVWNLYQNDLLYSGVNSQLSAYAVPWVPETFLARFPVSVKSL